MKPKEIPPPPRLALLGFGLLAGMALASGESIWRLEAFDAGLLAYAFFWYGLLGMLHFALAGEISRLAIQRAWYSANHSARPPLAGGLTALGLPALVIVPSVPLLDEQLPTTRLILFFMLLAGSGLAGWCVARVLAARPGIWPARLVHFAWRPRWIAGLLLLFTGLASWRVLTGVPGPRPVQASAGVAQAPAELDLIWIRVRGLGERIGLAPLPGEGPSPTPQLDAFAAGGVTFARVSERAWPSIAWPWPLSYLEPWLRPAALVDPEKPGLEFWQLADRLHREGYRCRALGVRPTDPALPPFEHPDHDRRERQRSLLLSQLLGRSLGALGYPHGSRAAPALETCFPFLDFERESFPAAAADQPPIGPRAGEKDFLYVSVETAERTPQELDQALGDWLAQLEAAGRLQHALVVLTGWPPAAASSARALPRRQPLVLWGPGLRPGQRVDQPISLKPLPSAVLAWLGLPPSSAQDAPPQEHQNQLYRLLRGL